MPEQPDNVEVMPRRVTLSAGQPIRAIVPTTIEEAFRLAQWIVGAGLAPDSYSIGGTGADRDQPDPQKIVIGILKSMEVGLAPITGLGTIAIVRKRPVIWGDGAVALVQQQGLVERVEQFYEGEEKRDAKEIAPTDFGDNFAAVFRIWRRGHANPYEGRFSVRDAKRAHLWLNAKRPPWIEYPKRMLLARARAYALREGFADALSGLSIREEIEDLPPEPPPLTNTDFLEDAPQRSITAQTEESGEPEYGSRHNPSNSPITQGPPTADRPEGSPDPLGTAEPPSTSPPPSGRTKPRMREG